MSVEAIAEELELRLPYAGTDWRNKMACPDSDVNFSPSREAYGSGPTQEALAAIAVCETECPVKNECLVYALQNNIKGGILGGMTTAQRNRVRKGLSSAVLRAAS